MMALLGEYLRLRKGKIKKTVFSNGWEFVESWLPLLQKQPPQAQEYFVPLCKWLKLRNTHQLPGCRENSVTACHHVPPWQQHPGWDVTHGASTNRRQFGPGEHGRRHMEVRPSQGGVYTGWMQCEWMKFPTHGKNIILWTICESWT